MTDLNEAGRTEAEQTLGLISAERMVFFSDAVVAIAITLLALDLPVPEGLTDGDFWRSVSSHSEEYWAFGISFIVIWADWTAHHRLFRTVERITEKVIALDMFWLFAIVVMPFATRVLTGDGAFRSRFIVYAAVQLLAAGSMLLMIQEIEANRLRAHQPELPGYRHSVRSALTVVLGFGVSVPLVFGVGRYAYICWIVMPMLGRLIRRADEWRLGRRKSAG